MMFEVPDLTNGNSIYLDTETMTVMEKMHFAVTSTYNTIVGLPSGTMVTVDEGEFIVTDGTAEFEADVPQSKIAWLDHPHYFATHIEIETGPETA
ncbi:hypothetical protein A8V01_19555 [Novosphingobium guangzhouense]|uniref:Uncharacterized protein n=2 Tax=Novosphingobium guangzhouense TaxID=1850347 RepID=A0A2K2G0Q5_9SPHN|nr:hypothetical protein A8V01_19555 [Novosphingobium guangzhouense]